MDRLGDILGYAGMVLEAAIIGLLFYRRAWRTLPIFCIYSVWSLLSDGINYVIIQHFPSSYFTAYFIGKVVDFVLQFGVLVEVAWSVVRPFRASLPRYTILFLSLLIAVATGLIWFFTDSSAFAHIPFAWRLLFRIDATETFLRIVLFLLLAGFSHVLSIGWRDRELQVMTGLGFYALGSVAVIVVQFHQGIGTHYRQLDQLKVVTYLCSLLYWIFSFAQQEAERRQFTPQMQGMLLAIAGMTQSTRVALTHSESDKNGKRRQP